MNSPDVADQDRGPELLAILWLFTSMALLTVLFKVYTRLRILRQTGLDDVLIFFSAILVLVCTILFTVDVAYGMGRHASSLSLEDAVTAVKINLIANPFGIMAYSIPNIAVAIFIDRILPLSRGRRLLLYTLVITQNIIAGVSCVLLFTQCTPTKSLWDPRIKPTSCLSASLLTHYSYFVGAYTAFTDVVLAVVPIWTFSQLKMARKAKIATSIIMGMTLAAAICAIVKTSKLNQLADLQDLTYGTVDLIITAVVEANVIIIAACIPSLRPFVLAISESMSQSTTLKKLKGSSLGWFSMESTRSAFGSFKLSSMGNGSDTAISSTDATSLAKDATAQEQDTQVIFKRTDYSVTPLSSQSK